MRHVPVLLPETIEALAPRDKGIYIDGTFGAGGVTRALLESADCIVLAIDRDPDAIAGGDALKQEFPDKFTLASGTFGDLDSIASAHAFEAVDGIADWLKR